jgi:hypothetical protein
MVQFGGFPLYLKRWNGGKDESLIKVLEIKPLKRADAMFVVPKDYVPVSPLTLLVGDATEAEAPVPAKPSSPAK